MLRFRLLPYCLPSPISAASTLDVMVGRLDAQQTLAEIIVFKLVG